jgi:sugar/nucleoside kinase (ribokinase family)
MSTYLGASEVFQPDGLRQICINPYTLLLIEGYVMRGGFGPDTLHLVGSLCRKIKVKNGAVVLALPPVQVIDLVRRDLLASLMVLDLVYGNAEEFLTLFEVRTVEEVERALQQLSIGAVITDGPRGAQAIIGRECVRVAAQDIEVVDLTGAGDAFLAGWILGVLQDLPIERSLMRGTSFAAKVIGQQGARLTPEEVRQLSATS